MAPGSFKMGNISNDGTDKKYPVHEVTLTKAFWIGKYPVTQGEWKKVMRTNPSGFPHSDNHPVEKVSWNDCQKFIEKLTEMNKGKFHFALPTEAQWEFAARSGGRDDWYAGGNRLEDFGWYYENSKEATHPVGEKEPNHLGIYDMSGNVWEWCQDYYKIFPPSTIQNPKGPGKGKFRVLRGGSWYGSASGCCPDFRNWDRPFKRYKYLGFRLVSAPVK